MIDIATRFQEGPPPALLNPIGALVGHYFAYCLVAGLVAGGVCALFWDLTVKRYFTWLPAFCWAALLFALFRSSRDTSSYLSPWGLRILVALAFGSAIHFVCLLLSGGWRRKEGKR